MSLRSFPEIGTTVFFGSITVVRFKSVRLMIRLYKLVFCGLLVFLAASPGARSQTFQGGQFTTQADTRKAAKTKSIRSLVSANGATKESPELSFQPGIGWQRAPTGKLSTADTPGNGVLGEIDGNKFADGGSTQFGYAKPSSANSTFRPAGSAASELLMMGPSSKRSGGFHLSSGAKSRRFLGPDCGS